MSLDETQKATVREWIQEGLGLSEIQSKIGSEFDLSLTYMEVRFLVDDLGVMPKDPEPEPSPEPEPEAPGQPSTPGVPPNPGGDGLPDAGAPPAPAADPFGGEDGNAGGAGGNVAVTVDQITRAGALASGKVTFSDGKGAGWTLDQMGRLGLSPDEPGYKPSQEDVMEFQVQLQRKLSGPGF